MGREGNWKRIKQKEKEKRKWKGFLSRFSNSEFIWKHSGRDILATRFLKMGAESTSKTTPVSGDWNEKYETQVVLNVYDLTPANNYSYWFGFGIFHSGIEGDFPICLWLPPFCYLPDFDSYFLHPLCLLKCLWGGIVETVHFLSDFFEVYGLEWNWIETLAWE